MKRTYKIALAASLLLCTVIVCRHLITSAPAAEPKVARSVVPAPKRGVTPPAHVQPRPDTSAASQSGPRAPSPRSAALAMAPSRPDPGEAIVSVANAPRYPQRIQRVALPPRPPLAKDLPKTRRGDHTTRQTAARFPVSKRSPSNVATYAVREGDTFSSIAVAVYGSEQRWRDIRDANPKIAPWRLRPGQIIAIPPATTAPARTPTREDPKEPAAQYVVRVGDTLTTIAQQHYRKASVWRKIYEANRDRIGPNPDRLIAGISLRLDPRLGMIR